MTTVFLSDVPVKRCFLDEFKVKGTAVLPMGFEGGTRPPRRKPGDRRTTAAPPHKAALASLGSVKSDIHPRPPRSTSRNRQCSRCPFLDGQPIRGSVHRLGQPRGRFLRRLGQISTLIK